MNQDEIIKLNVDRVRRQLKEFFRLLRPELLEHYKSLVITDEFGSEVSLDDIDFSGSCIFISDFFLLPYISIYALQKINKVLYPDTTLSGHYSMIRTDYLYMESNEARYTKLDLSSVELESVPEMYKPTSPLTKDLCIWKFSKDVGQGDNAAMYRMCNERLEERYFRNQKDWVFFVGSLDDFKKTYNTQLPIPVYIVTSKVAVEVKKNQDDQIMSGSLQKVEDD